jgi:glycerol-3-phosphate dehydrogenase (NAD(P)+)
MKVCVIGSGGWGTALALVLLENGNEVTLWSYHQEESDVLRQTRENPMLKGVPLPESLDLTTDLSCVKGCKVVVLATPSFAVRSTARQMAPLLDPGTVVVLVSKGIEKDTSLTLTQVVEQEVGPSCPVAALCGPSHAEEVGRRVPTAVVSASQDQQCAEMVQDLFMNERFRVYASDDVIGVELGAALKNVIALCAGCIDGMGLGDNTKAMLMTRGLTEIARLGVAMGGRQETFAGLTGVGDLIVTCCSMHSRNRRCGILIGQGVPVEQALQQSGGVVEGYYAAATARTLAQKLGVEMPIAQSAYEVLYQGKDPHVVLRELMTREKKHEIEQSWVQQKNRG